MHTLTRANDFTKIRYSPNITVTEDGAWKYQSLPTLPKNRNHIFFGEKIKNFRAARGLLSCEQFVWCELHGLIAFEYEYVNMKTQLKLVLSKLHDLSGENKEGK